jgi:ubiquinone/menaquinone biosynthesis C-methylase UbiE
MSIEPSFVSTGSADTTAKYEAGAEPLTLQCIPAAFAMVRGIGPGMRVLDVAAGPGGLSLAAARAGAQVLAADLTPAMVTRCAERLKPYANCAARVMDAQALQVENGAFDATFSMFGVVNLPDWRLGFRELARVTRAGGHGCVGTWRDPRTVGPVPYLVEAWRTTFDDESIFNPSEGVGLISSPETFRAEMTAAGFEDVEVRAIDVIWTSPSRDAFLLDPDRHYGFMPPYAALTRVQRDRLAEGLRRAVVGPDVDGIIRVVATALIAAGRRP